MNYVRTYRMFVVAALLFVVGSMLHGPASVSASTETIPTVPPEIAVEAGSKLLFSSRAQGVQIYECLSGRWILHAPRALLFDPNTRKPTGVHYGGIDRGVTPGPWWESTTDGSRVRAGLAGQASSPNPDSIPLFLLNVKERFGEGTFTAVNQIQRLNTVGGIAPTGSCQTGAQRSVPYKADYYFYAAP